MKRLWILTFTMVTAAAFVIGPSTSWGASWKSKKDPKVSENSGSSMSHYLTSVLYDRLGRYEDAVIELRAAADDAPESMSLQKRLLAAYYMNKDFENALVVAKRATDADAENVVLQIWLGRIQYQLEDFDSAAETFQHAIDLAPDSTVGYEALAEVVEKVNDVVGAADVYQRLIELAPDAPVLHYRLGLSLAKMDDNEAAIKSLVRALELNDRLTSALYLLGILYIETNEYDEAISSLNRYLEENPENVSAKSNLLGAIARQGDYSGSYDIVNDIIESGGANPEHHLQRMYLMLRSKDTSDASLAIAPSDAPIIGTLMRAAVRKEAGEPYTGILEGLDDMEGDLDSECTFYWNEVLSLFGIEETGSFLEDMLSDLIKEADQTRVLKTVLGRTYMSMDRDEDAKAAFEEVLRDHGSEKWIHYYLATVTENLDTPKETEQHLKACLKLDPNDPDIMNFLGYMYAEENMQLDEAEALLDRALQMEPENGFYLDSLGWIYYRKGDAEKAISLIRRAIRSMTSDDAVLRDHLGDAYLLDRQSGPAVDEWRRALRLDPTIEGVADKIKKYEKDRKK